MCTNLDELWFITASTTDTASANLPMFQTAIWCNPIYKTPSTYRSERHYSFVLQRCKLCGEWKVPAPFCWPSLYRVLHLLYRMSECVPKSVWITRHLTLKYLHRLQTHICMCVQQQRKIQILWKKVEIWYKTQNWIYRLKNTRKSGKTKLSESLIWQRHRQWYMKTWLTFKDMILSSPDKKVAVAVTVTEQYLDIFCCFVLYLDVFCSSLNCSPLRTSLSTCPQTPIPDTGTIRWKGHNTFYQDVTFHIWIVGVSMWNKCPCTGQISNHSFTLFYFSALFCFISFLCSMLVLLFF